MNKKDTAFITILEQRKWLSEDVYELCCTRPEGFHFRSGQHITLNIDGDERDYTIVSPESEDKLLLLVKALEDGKVSKKLARLPVGKELQMSGSGGYLVERPTDNKRVLVATGTGIAPFVSMLTNGMEASFLLHGVRTMEELYYRHILEETVPQYIPCLSGEPCRKQSRFCYDGYVTGYIRDLLPVREYEFYLCGRWDMIKEVTHVIDTRFPDSSVYNEGFY